MQNSAALISALISGPIDRYIKLIFYLVPKPVHFTCSKLIVTVQAIATFPGSTFARWKLIAIDSCWKYKDISSNDFGNLFFHQFQSVQHQFESH